MESFDSFLKSGGRNELYLTNFKPKDSAIADIRSWGGLSEVTSPEELDRLVVERRTKLWRMVLATYTRDDDSLFTVPPDPQVRMTLRRADRNTLEWGSINPTDTLSPRLSLLMDESVPSEGQSLYSPFTIPIAPPSRSTQYTLRPREPASHILPLQQVHISPYAIPDELANLSCRELTQNAIIEHINDIFGTSVSLERVLDLYGFSQLVSRGVDIGTLYAYLRSFWPPAPSIPPSRFASMVSRHPPTRYLRFYGYNTSATNDEVPRRLWDLYSNRVVEFNGLWPLRKSDVIPGKVWAVSHNWVADADRRTVMTAINGYEWPVPIPKATTLDHIRIELLNMGAEYVFLDVLCLRQQGQEDKEEIRREEWKDDIPNLGNVYRHDPYQTTIAYFNGLGLPLNLLEEELSSLYHWLNRSWTLQETVTNWLPGGLSKDISGIFPGGSVFMSRLQRSLGVSALGNQPGISLQSLLKEFQQRPGYADRKPFDQVAALGYLLFPPDLRDSYNESYPSVEQPWNNVISQLPGVDLLYLLVCCPLSRQADPAAGEMCKFSTRGWWPTWHQLMAYPLDTSPSIDYKLREHLHVALPIFPQPPWDDNRKVNKKDKWHYHSAVVIDACSINQATSTFIMSGKDGRSVEISGFTTPSNIGSDLDGGTFTLVGLAGLECWVVGTSGGQERMLRPAPSEVPTGDEEGLMLEIEKVTVGRINAQEDRDRLWVLASSDYSAQNFGSLRHVCYKYRPEDTHEYWRKG